MIINSITEIIRNTPIIKLNNFDTFGNEIYMKLG